MAPNWNVNVYEVVQQGAFADPSSAGTLTLRASVRNRGDREQPAPLLRVSLEDRFGNRIATRDLAPREYLGAAFNDALLAPGRRLDATVSLVDPGGKAVGFELDACLPRTGNRIACANDAPATVR